MVASDRNLRNLKQERKWIVHITMYRDLGIPAQFDLDVEKILS